jgi:hypothetical protein
VTVGLRVRRAPALASLGISAAIVQGRKQLQRALPVELSGRSLRSGTVRLTLPGRLARGRHSLAIRLLETTPAGLAQGSVMVTRRVTAAAG